MDTFASEICAKVNSEVTGREIDTPGCGRKCGDDNLPNPKCAEVSYTSSGNRSTRSPAMHITSVLRTNPTAVFVINHTLTNDISCCANLSN